MKTVRKIIRDRIRSDRVGRLGMFALEGLQAANALRMANLFSKSVANPITMRAAEQLADEMSLAYPHKNWSPSRFIRIPEQNADFALSYFEQYRAVLSRCPGKASEIEAFAQWCQNEDEAPLFIMSLSLDLVACILAVKAKLEGEIDTQTMEELLKAIHMDNEKYGFTPRKVMRAFLLSINKMGEIERSLQYQNCH